jgi:hypothetical protein
MTDFRALCAELHAAFNTYAVAEEHHKLLVRADAALAQPTLNSPEKQELKQLFDDQSGYINDEQVMWWSDFYHAARALLARYGNQPPTPISLSERKPTETDCDEDGFCWFYTPLGWHMRPWPTARKYTYWLPCWALVAPRTGAT